LLATRTLRQDHLQRFLQRHPVGEQTQMQDKTGTHTRDRETLRDYRPRRTMAQHPQLPQPHHQVGDSQVGRDTCRLRKEITHGHLEVSRK